MIITPSSEDIFRLPFSLKEKAEALNGAIDRLEFKLENYDEHMLVTENSLRSFNENK